MNKETFLKVCVLMDRKIKKTLTKDSLIVKKDEFN